MCAAFLCNRKRLSHVSMTRSFADCRVKKCASHTLAILIKYQEAHFFRAGRILRSKKTPPASVRIPARSAFCAIGKDFHTSVWHGLSYRIKSAEHCITSLCTQYVEFQKFDSSIFLSFLPVLSFRAHSQSIF